MNRRMNLLIFLALFVVTVCFTLIRLLSLSNVTDQVDVTEIAAEVTAEVTPEVTANQPTSTSEPTEIPTETATATDTPVPTETSTSSNTPRPTQPPATPIGDTATPTASPTSTATLGIVLQPTRRPTQTPTDSSLDTPETEEVQPTVSDESDTYTRYIVRRGDTLISIAREFGVSTEAIVELNNFSNTALVLSGQEILIPQRSVRPTISMGLTSQATTSAMVTEDASAQGISTAQAQTEVAQMSSDEPTASPTLAPTRTARPTNTPRPTATVTPTATFTPINLDATDVAELETVVAYESETDDLATRAPNNRDENDVIGDASIYPFYDREMPAGETQLIELDLIMENVLITPTPYGLATAVAINTDVTRPPLVGDVGEGATPRPAADVFRVQRVPSQLVAELECAEAIFDGCGTLPVLEVELRGANHWEWLITASEDVNGSQGLTLRLYRADDEGNAVGDPLWQDRFIIEVVGDGLLWANSLVLMILTFVGASIVGYIVWRTRTAPDPRTPKPKRDISVFISYQRSSGFAYATMINQHLNTLGADVFMDVHDLHQGNFEDNLNDALSNVQHVVVVLAPGTLNSEWVVREVAKGLKLGKNIVPVLVNDYRIDTDPDMPQQLIDLEFQKQNAITMPYEHYQSALDRIARFVGLIDNDETS